MQKHDHEIDQLEASVEPPRNLLLAEQPHFSEPIPQLLTLEEVACLLRCCVKTIRRRIDSGEMKATKQRGRWLVEANVVRALLEAGLARLPTEKALYVPQPLTKDCSESAAND